MTEEANMGMPRTPSDGSVGKRKVGVLAATSEDTKFGAETCCKYGYEPICAHISPSPQAQTKLQMREPKDGALTQATIGKVKELVAAKVEAIVIYCNSLSSVIDLVQVRVASAVPIITPLDAYESRVNEHQCLGILAANCQCVGNLERFILNQKEEAIVIGLGSLSLVNDVESGICGEKIISARQLIQTVMTLWIHGAQIIFLACTHFSQFHSELVQHFRRLNFPLEIYEPTADMMALLAQRLAA